MFNLKKIYNGFFPSPMFLLHDFSIGNFYEQMFFFIAHKSVKTLAVWRRLKRLIMHQTYFLSNVSLTIFQNKFKRKSKKNV